MAQNSKAYKKTTTKIIPIEDEISFFDLNQVHKLMIIENG